MSFFSFFNKNSEKEVVAVFDIGSASVGGALVSLEEGEKPEVIFSRRISVPLPEDPGSNFQNVESEMIKKFGILLKVLSKDGLSLLSRKDRKIDNAFISLSPPWVRSKVDKVKIENPEEKEVSEQVLEEMLENHEVEILKKFDSDKGSFDLSLGDNEVIEQHIIQSKLNGYPTSNLFQPAKTVELSVFTSVVPKNFIKRLEESVLRVWNIENFHLNSFSFAFSETVRDLFSDSRTYLAISITGEAAEVCVTEGGVIEEVFDLPFGLNVLLRKISKKFDVPLEVSQSFLNLYLEKSGGRDFIQEMEKVVEESKKAWVDLFKERAHSFTEKDSFNLRKVFLGTSPYSEKVFLPFIKKSFTFEKNEKKPERSGKNDPTIILLDKEKLSHFTLFPPKNADFDSPLAINSLFAKKSLTRNYNSEVA